MFLFSLASGYSFGAGAGQWLELFCGAGKFHGARKVGKR